VPIKQIGVKISEQQVLKLTRVRSRWDASAKPIHRVDFPVSQQEFGKMTVADPESIKLEIRAMNTASKWFS
jgi:hypothetical protein